MDLRPGDFVEVPLGTREATGIVWSVRAAPGGNLKAVIAKRDLPSVREPLRALIDWIAKWTLAPRGVVLRTSAGARSCVAGAGARRHAAELVIRRRRNCRAA